MKRSLWILALVASLAIVVLGTVWIVTPAAYPFGRADRVTVSVSHLIEHGLAGWLLVGFGTLGLALSVVWGLGRGSVSRLVGVGAVVEALFFGLVMSDVSMVSALGYLLAIIAPIPVVGLVLVAALRRQRWAFVTGLAMLGLVGIAVLTGVLTPALVSTFVGNVVRALGSYSVRIGWGVAMAGLTAIWVVVAARALPRRHRAPDPAVVRRWGIVATIVAALCPAPYGFVRLSWLTPWALDVPADARGSAGFPTRLQGSFIGVAAVMGVVLTLGLISRWGETFPRWIPVLGGRSVPVMLAVVPGATVALAMTLAALGWIINTVERSESVGRAAYALLVFPFAIWGPALGFAVYAYWRRRTSGSVFYRTAEKPVSTAAVNVA